MGQRKKSKYYSTEIVSQNVHVDVQHLKRFCEVCGFLQSDVLPLPYLQILSAPLNASLLASPDFPFPALGLIQTGIQLTSHRQVHPQEPLTIICRMGKTVDVPKGTLIPIVTLVKSGDETVWTSEITLLSRSKKSLRKNTQKKDVLHTDWHSEWDLDASVGRRYAKISGDYNPIHLSGLTSRLFGFDQPIAHGMWVFSRCLAAMEYEMPLYPLSVEVSFKKPIPLPSRVRFVRKKESLILQFGLCGEEQFYLSGTVTGF